jgi:hypothetical protein
LGTRNTKKKELKIEELTAQHPYLKTGTFIIATLAIYKSTESIKNYQNI